MAFTTAQLMGALLTVDGRATEGGIIDIPPGARLLLDVISEGQADGALLEDIAAALDTAAASAESASASAALAQAVAGADTADGLITILDADAGSTFRQQQDARLTATIARRGVFMGDYPRQGAETTDDAALDRALAYADANGITLIIFAAADYTFSTTHVIAREGMTFAGLGWKTRLIWGADQTIFQISGNEFHMRDLQTFAPAVGRTQWPIVTTGLRPVFDHIFCYGVSGAWRNGIHIDDGNDATITNGSLFNHACIRVGIYDCSISNTWVQAISTEYGICLDSGQGNLELTDVKIVPPLTSVAGAKAGLYIAGPAFKIKLNGLYLDGNGALNTREGVILKDGVGQIEGSISSNNFHSDVVVLDGVIGADLHYSGQGNNQDGTGAREIVVRQTGAQPNQAIRLTGLALRTTAVPGTAGPAVEVESPTFCSEVTVDVDVVQPAAGGGYSLPEIKVHDPDNAVVIGRGSLSKYRAHGKVAVANGDTAVSVNLSAPYPLAYRPLPSDIQIQFEGTQAVVGRIQFTSDNQLYVPFTAAASGAGFLHWRVDFNR